MVKFQFAAYGDLNVGRLTLSVIGRTVLKDEVGCDVVSKCTEVWKGALLGCTSYAVSASASRSAGVRGPPTPTVSTRGG